MVSKEIWYFSSSVSVDYLNASQPLAISDKQHMNKKTFSVLPIINHGEIEGMCFSAQE